MFLFNENPQKRVVERDAKGCFVYDSEHSFNVWKARKEAGLPYERVVELPEHNLVGKQLFDGGKVFLIERVTKQWDCGWFLLLLIQCGGSHGTVFWESLGCFNQTIIDLVETSRKKYKLI